MRKNSKYFIMLLSVAVVALTTLNVAGAFANPIELFKTNPGHNSGPGAAGSLPRGGSTPTGGEVGPVLGGALPVIAVVGIVIVVAVLLIIKFVLPRVRQNK